MTALALELWIEGWLQAGCEHIMRIQRIVSFCLLFLRGGGGGTINNCQVVQLAKCQPMRELNE